MQVKVYQCIMYTSCENYKGTEIQFHPNSSNRFIFINMFTVLHFQQDVLNKPYWTLRLVSEQREAEVLEVKKDTQRADEIKAMKQAWESAEPGRAVKVIREQSLW